MASLHRDYINQQDKHSHLTESITFYDLGEYCIVLYCMISYHRVVDESCYSLKPVHDTNHIDHFMTNNVRVPVLYGMV